MAETGEPELAVTFIDNADYDYAVDLLVDGENLGVLLTGNRKDLNGFFILVSGFLVFFMQCGFAMLSVGSIRQKNAKNIILKNLLDACFGALCFYFIGYGLAYGGDGDDTKGNTFIGWQGFALNSIPSTDWHGWFFQFAFAATAATIVSGAVAERCRFEGYLAYAGILTSLVYPVVVHWIWSSKGWASAFRDQDERLFGVGVIDFAGCGVVHMVGGLSGLAGAAIIGPRIGRFDSEGKPNEIPGHNASLAILGVFILWFGWYGFNPGSALAIIGSSAVASLCAITTTLSAGAATVSALAVLMYLEYSESGHVVYDLMGASNGTLGGLVGITAACSVVEPWAAILIGAMSGAVYVGASRLVSHVLKIDDPLDAVAVHGCCGAWGLIMAAAFASKDKTAAAYGAGYENDFGFFMGGGGALFGSAIVTIIVVTLWVLGIMVPFFMLMHYLGLLRVDEDEERLGLDVSHHGGAAYEPPAIELVKKAVEDSADVDKEESIKLGKEPGQYEALLARVQHLEQTFNATK